MRTKSLLILALSLCGVLAQNGDKPGEVQTAPPIEAPPAPPLTPDEALKTFKLPPGFTIEVVAADPLVEAPVAMHYGPDGRLWVLEMRGFMPNVDGKGEDEPLGRIVVLDDENNDGRMDKKSVFIDGLVMARAMALVRDGVLVAEPPFLWFCRDTDGDGKADEKNEVAADYGSQSNPEHTANGLMWGLDNWIYSANHTVRFKNTMGEFEREPTVFRGQWGITQDDWGRQFYNSNSDHMRVDLVPAHYITRNSHLNGPLGINYQAGKDQTCWPGRVNPGINRGYQQGMLRDGKLARFTAACGPVIYRGSTFPEEFYGDAFVAEPSGNFVRRNALSEKDGVITAVNAYDKDEFLTSTDERFRPVNLYNGPDGNLYVVDMYRGVLQHRIYLTTYLRNQALSRKLDAPINLGRIYRIRPTASKPAARPNLAKAPVAQLVAALENRNGWWRDTAQQLLVERADPASLPLLKKLASGPGAYPAVHALWTLDALGELDQATAQAALKSKEPIVRVHALRTGEQFFSEGEAMLASALELKNDPDKRVQWQLALSLGQATNQEKAMAELLLSNEANPFIRDAVFTGLKNRELSFLTHLLSLEKFADKSTAREDMLRILGRAICESRKGAAIEQFVAVVANDPKPWRQAALLNGLASMKPVAPRGRPAPKGKPLQLTKEPQGLKALLAHSDPVIKERAQVGDTLLVWPGKPGVSPDDIVVPLTVAQQAQFDSGKELYTITCGACHQPHGNGQDGLAPPLLDSDWVTGPPSRLARIIMHGMKGPVTVKGKVFEMEMPPLNVLDDEQIAALMTYVRREWNHTSSPVDAAYVSKVRKETEGREEAWTEKELEGMK